MKRLPLILVVALLATVLFISPVAAQCQAQQNNNTASIQQSQLLQQQLNQLTQLQQALQLSLSSRPDRGNVETQVASVRKQQPAATSEIRARQLTAAEVLASRGYVQRVNSATGRREWVSPPGNPNKLTPNELVSLRLRQRPAIVPASGSTQPNIALIDGRDSD